MGLTLFDLLYLLYDDMKKSPLDVQLTISQDRKMFFGTYHDDHIRKLICKRPYVKRWAVFNDESEIIIELEG